MVGWVSPITAASLSRRDGRTRSRHTTPRSGPICKNQPCCAQLLYKCKKTERERRRKLNGWLPETVDHASNAQFDQFFLLALILPRDLRGCSCRWNGLMNTLHNKYSSCILFFPQIGTKSNNLCIQIQLEIYHFEFFTNFDNSFYSKNIIIVYFNYNIIYYIM
jgi:hypothetical protein